MKVKITWKLDGEVFTENCYLVPDDAELCGEDGEIVPLDFFDDFKKMGFVLLENEKGVFLLDAKQIVKIDNLD